jgi:hypothetical protein
MQSDVHPLVSLLPPGSMIRVAIDGHLLRCRAEGAQQLRDVDALVRRTVVRLRGHSVGASQLTIAPHSDC